MTAWILDATNAAESADAGGKARALARATRAGLPVPAWFVLSSAACTDDMALTPAVVDALARAIRRLSPDGAPLAVRSSAIDEDGTSQSFAGQLESFLNVSPSDVPCRVVDVWRSAFSERNLTYRHKHGLTPRPQSPAVLIQRMVQPRAAGVAFSADPVSGRRGVAVVTAVAGLADALASGYVDGDTWLVDRSGAIVERRPVASNAPLADHDVCAVAALARLAASHFGTPQDIEWALGDRLYLLQSRPITSLPRLADPDAPPVIWDNSNIVESYGGVTTPLTFSFARDIYPSVYRQFCRMMAVPERTIAEHDDVFQNLLGLIRGRLYYNLLNWYRALALLPGYSVNRTFMEQMMGVKDALPAEQADAIASAEKRGRLLDLFYLSRMMATLTVTHCTLNRRIDAFYKRLDVALTAPMPPLEHRRPDELVACYRELRGQLLLKWDAPLVNDFFAMIFYGALRRLVMGWCGDERGTLQNDLIAGEGDLGNLISAEPAIRMQRLARLAAEDPALVDLLAHGTLESILDRRESAPKFFDEYSAYLAKFGDRTVNELKLESTTLADDPLPLLRAIAALALRPSPVPTRSLPRPHPVAALAGHPVRRVIFNWVVRHARRRVRDRENLRFERTRLFGRVRRIFIELGRRLHDLDLLETPRDVFYLEVDEVLALVDGRSTCTNVRSLVALRRTEFREYENGPAPDDRFETRGPVYHGHEFKRQQAAMPEIGDARHGLGCSPGIVRGQVRRVTDPRAADLRQPMILVAEHTDPGWIMVFPSALGVLVERGSLLSHASIVARELGIPAVVSVPGLTRWLRDGDWVEMDGATGAIRRLAVAHA